MARVSEQGRPDRDDSKQVSMRAWPMWVAVVVQLTTLGLTITPSINNTFRFGTMMLGPLFCVFLFLTWLVCFSRMSWRDKVVTLVCVTLPALAVSPWVEGKMALTLWIYGAPLAWMVAFLGLLFTERRGLTTRAMCLGGTMTLLWSLFLLFRLDGFDGGYLPELAFRWSPDHEAALVANAESVPVVDGQTTGSWQVEAVQWPAFRGGRASRVHSGLSKPLNWEAVTPQEIWRSKMGPGWSSFAFVSGRLFTQEQRGPNELVTCYDGASGTPIWSHLVENRFEDVVSGAGPRATPAYADGRIFSYGSKAVLCSIDASTGEEVWRRDLVAEVNAQVPVWGFSGSPVVIDDRVLVYAGGDAPYGLCAFDAETGTPVWQIASSGMNFSSVEVVELDGERLALFGDEAGVMAIQPQDGEVAWHFKPRNWKGPAMVQPQQISSESVMVALGDAQGLARLDISREDTEWKVREVWSSRGLKPSFNDFVYHDEHLYGFDQNIFTCIDARTGKRAWKRGRYGFGQVVLLEDVGQLIVLTERGEVVLLEANPREHRELGRKKALQGKTWNHPIVVGDQLFVRNGEAAACIQLTGDNT